MNIIIWHILESDKFRPVSLQHFIHEVLFAIPISLSWWSAKVIADLHNKRHTIPADILPTSDRPDLTIVDYTKKTIHIFELTVPYESNIDRQHIYKSNKYAALMSDLELTGFRVTCCAFEIGCRGTITKDNFYRLSEFVESVNIKERKTVKTLCKDLMKISCLCSFYIFKSKDHPEWEQMDVLKANFK